MEEAIRQYPTNYPSDVSDGEWEFCAAYLTLMREDAPQRGHCLRAVFNALRYFVKTGCPWRYLPADFPPYYVVYQQRSRWVEAGVLETMAHDLRRVLRLLDQREPEPTAAIFDARVLQSSPESGARAGYDGHKRRKGSKVHAAVDTLGHLLAIKVTAANEQERQQVGDLARQVQDVTGDHVSLAYVDQGYTGEDAASAAKARGIDLLVVRLPEAKRGFVLLPRRWVVERSFAWSTRFRRLVRDYERSASSLAGYHWLAFISLMLSSLNLQSA